MKDWPNKNGPKDAATSKGPNAKAVQAIASRNSYTKAQHPCKRKAEGSDALKFAHSARSRNHPVETGKRMHSAQVLFHASDGRTWRYGGKRARVLAMLAENGEGVTQWDCLPWHTRLGGTIHAMRRDGFENSTEIEGEYRHARYRLVTRGRLIIQAETGSGSLKIQRETA